MLATYRRLGADPPFGDPRGYHGGGFEGYFWRITHREEGVVAVVLAGVSRDGDGRRWGTAGLAVHPGGFVRSALVESAEASRDRLAVRLGAELEADHARLRVDLGRDARLDVRLTEQVGWPGRAFGALGAAGAVPGLSQYWHPHLLGARVEGTLVAGARTVDLRGATVYAEKNWGPYGFPDDWWWGQAHGFERDDVCVAFAGGAMRVGPLPLRATALVVRAGDEWARLRRPLGDLRVDVGEGIWSLEGRTPTARVEVRGHPNGSAPHLLPVPVPHARRHTEQAAVQHLAGEVHLRLRRGRRTVFAGSSPLAGLERGDGTLSCARRDGPRP